MYLVVIAWIYVVLMMSVAEAANTTGTVLGAVITFVLYGVGPCALVVYLMRTPARNKAAKMRCAEEVARHQAQTAVEAEPAVNLPQATSLPPDDASHAASGSQAVALAPDIAGIAPMRKEP